MCGSPRVDDADRGGRWACRDCTYVTGREATAYVMAAIHSGQHGHAMTYFAPH
jgi:Zn-finger protein